MCCCRRRCREAGTDDRRFTAGGVLNLVHVAAAADGRLDHALALAGVRREVGLVEEARKQDKVAKVHRDRQLDVHLGDVTAALAGGLQESVGPDVDRAAHHHLRQLQRRDQHRDRARGLKVEGAQRIVRVHHRVDAVVHHDEPTGRRGVLGVAEPAVHQHRDVVVPVQEDERLLPQHDEHGVAQLGQLRQHKQPRPEATDSVVFDETATREREREKSKLDQKLRKQQVQRHNTVPANLAVPRSWRRNNLPTAPRSYALQR